MNADEQMQKIIAQEVTADDEVIYRGFTRGALDVAFSAISDKDHWKEPLNGEVPEADVEVARAAAILYAGSPIQVRPGSKIGMVRITGPGYYVCIGA